MGPLAPSSQSVASLPEDCLVIIIQLLGQNRSALHALLQVSRQFFRLTVPALYKSPFRMLESKKEAWTFPERTQRQVLLLQLFLKAIQIKHTHSLSLDNALKHRPRRTERRQWRREQKQHQQKQGQQQQLQQQHGATLPATITCATATSSLPSNPQSSTASTSTWSGSTKKSLRFVVPLSSTLTNKRREWAMPRRRLISLPLSKKESNVKSSLSLSSPLALLSPSQEVSGIINRPSTDLISHAQQAQFAAETDSHNRLHICSCAAPSSSSLSTLAAQRRQGRAAKVVKSFFSMPGMYAGWWNSSSSRVEQHPDSSPCSLCDDAPNKQYFQFNQQHQLSNEQDVSVISANGPLALGWDDRVSDSNNSDEDGRSVDGSYYVSDDNTSESDISECDSESQDDLESDGHPAPTPWPCAPDLGPFSPPKPTHARGHWPSVFPRPSPDTKQDVDQDQCQPKSDMEQLMADYLYHYVEHDHPRLARQLSFIFPSIPSDVFEHLPPSTLSGSNSSSPQSSMPSNHSVLNLLQSFQQPQKNAKTIEMAQATRSKIERDLLQHSPQRIKTLCISAPRFHTILHSLQVESTMSPVQGTWEDKKPRLRSPTSSFSSLFSFLSTSPFSTAPSSASSLSTWSSTSSSSVSSSSHSLHSSTASLSSHWNMPRISGKLSRLSRLELFDVHYDFDLEAVIDFLRTHDQVYGTIREIKVGGPDDLGRWTPPGLIRILQSLKRVKVLDMTDWREAIKYLDMIPTKHLETLLLGNVRMTTLNSGGSSTEPGTEQLLDSESENQEDPQIRALKSCRRLKELRMPVLIDGLFKWAVQDRKRRQRLAGQWVYGPDPVHIQVVHLSGSNTGPLVSTLVDVTDAFRDSLQTLQSTSWSDMAETLSCCQPLTWNWCLPRLQVLDLQGEIACRFKVQALEHCPELRVLRLSLPHSVLPSPSTGTRGRIDSDSLQEEGERSRECECSGQQQYTSLTDLFTPRSLGTRRSILPKLQELNIAGDWGLDDSSLLGMAEVVPTLTRLSLLRCEGLSAAGVARVIPCFRVLHWLEVNKMWYSELENVSSKSYTHSRIHIEFS
ncbi:MAG: hypothetical protein BYD32DRAFT_459308 [Podila humilis]|nr:MAG: hypothetical protein BYD32DRAFT_459308 [Podila humilis]